MQKQVAILGQYVDRFFKTSEDFLRSSHKKKLGGHAQIFTLLDCCERHGFDPSIEKSINAVNRTNASLKSRSSESVHLKKRSTATFIHCSWSFFQTYSFTWLIFEKRTFTFHLKDRFVNLISRSFIFMLKVSVHVSIYPTFRLPYALPVLHASM